MEAGSERPISIVEEEGGPILFLRGAIDIFLADELRQAAIDLQGREVDIHVCCQKADHLDTSAVQVLLALKKGLQAKGKAVKITRISSQVENLLKLVGLTDLRA
ncbi:MAG: STAS domain-containing protein [Deltaproteobacteria bacterium]|nr:STAS domain-containing protein [Deltaproteobacteria bacterium]